MRVQCDNPAFPGASAPYGSGPGLIVLLSIGVASLAGAMVALMAGN